MALQHAQMMVHHTRQACGCFCEAENHMIQIVDLIDKVIMNHENDEIIDSVADKVVKMMEVFPIFE